MRLTRARYITICQQFLVTAVVVMVGLSAAGVMTLQIVSPEAQAPGTDGRALGLAPAVQVTEAPAATAPITPKVREVKVVGVAFKAPVAHPGLRLAVVSKPTVAHGFATVGVTWKPGVELAENQIKIQVRTLKHGAWSGWTKIAYHDDHGPDAGTEEAARATRPGTDPLVIGNVDQVQMRAFTATGTAPADLELAVIDPGTGKVTRQSAAINTADLPASDRNATSAPPIESTAGMGGTGEVAVSGDAAATSAGPGSSDISLAAMKVAPKPLIYSRAQWGANESMRDKSSLHYGTIETGFIHHTVNANNYTPDEVPALIRGIYAYHTQSRGWSDIGYNFLVDRFGRIWEGRYGGVDRPVVGAHTLGYNEYSFAMSAIGNFDIAEPPQAVLDAYARLFAWKLSLYNIPATATHLWVKDRYLNAINGHRDVGQTACPGRYLYAKIPSIRTAAQLIQNNAQLAADPVDRPMIAAPTGLVAPTTKPRAAVAQPPLTLPARTSLAGNSWPDLLVKSARTGAIQVVPTLGIRAYAGRIVSPGDWSVMNLITGVGDVTGDGKSDVLARNRKTGIARIFPGDGLGHVSRTGIAPTTAFKSVTSLTAVLDFNRDGRNDVVGVDRKSGALMLFPGAGSGTFGAPVVLKKTWPYVHTAGVGDFNGDGQPDLMVIAADNTVSLVPGANHGKSLGKPQRLGAPAARISNILGWGDLTGDGHSDLMVRYAGNGQSTIYAGTGTGRTGQKFGPFTTLSGLTKASLAPMVGTRAADFIGRDSTGHLVVVPNNGMSNVAAPLPTNLKVPTATQVIDAGDWNRDGKADVIVRTANGSSAGGLLVLYPGLGNGKFGQPRSLGTGWKTVKRLTAVGDVTGDGYPDLMGRVGSGPVTIFPGNGNKAFKAPVLAPATLRTFNQIGPNAWPANGHAFVSADGSFVPFVGSDLGSALRAANGQVDPDYDSYVGVGDVNGDGVADLLVREKGTGTIWLLPGKASGGFAPRMWVADGFAGYQLIS
ncbi:MAG: N-acetylmuramoyl-L-alanine amidase, family 2 [Marmoricola sp.]|nr:N-acetylmuramoyl-L-alanine amidase, family 2 [Marmoricola sp.]